MGKTTPDSPDRRRARRPELPGFASERIDRIRRAGGVWALPGGEIRLPEVFGFCRGVERALTMLAEAVAAHHRHTGRMRLFGQIIHNPWVNAYFEARGVQVLTAEQIREPERHIQRADCAVIPAFGVPLPIERRLDAIGCRIVDTSCGDVRRLWAWAQREADSGYGVLIFGRAGHDETVVTKSRLADRGGRYLVVGNMGQARRFCDLITGRADPARFREHFGDDATNATDLSPFHRLAHVSQTTMLYDETLAVRQLLGEAYEERFGRDRLDERLVFQPTVCRATQARQTAAVALCRKGCDLVVVVGGFGSSNTRHLYELARSYAPAWFIEDDEAIRSDREIATFDPAEDRHYAASGWLPEARPLRIGVLAGASSPEIVIGQVVEKLARFLQA
jgi:4-hydroxy-3-methylbut-2-enyl diphosphate reductase